MRKFWIVLAFSKGIVLLKRNVKWLASSIVVNFICKCNCVTLTRAFQRQLWSISSTFYTRVFCTKVLSYFCQSQNITREKLLEALSYKKCVHKMLMKLTPWTRISQEIKMLRKDVLLRCNTFWYVSIRCNTLQCVRFSYNRK